MDVVGSEIGQKMRSAIKAKLTELGCYVDDELPDYVMVMVANKRTRAQMEDDLQLFLGDNTELFVNWLHQVLKKLQEVTVPAAPKEPEKIKEKVKEKKEKKSKDKKDKDKTKSSKKTDSVKKSKKKDKHKQKIRKKEEKKAHKSKKKSKHHDIIRPNVPPLLMNMEKESEPSITDVFAGQILKNHGVIIDTPKEEKVETKPVIKDVKRPILPIIDPATISQPEVEVVDISSEQQVQGNSGVPGAAPREEQIKEINEIEAKIQGLKQKLAEQLDSMSDDEDFLNIRTEAEELMNDFAEDVFQEITSQAQPVDTPPVVPEKSPSPPPIPKTLESIDLEKDSVPPENTSKSSPPKEIEVLPQIELKLPKRPREKGLRVLKGLRRNANRISGAITSPQPKAAWGTPQSPSGKALLPSGRAPFPSGRALSGRVLLLMRAVADAHKSLLNIPPKVEAEPPKIKRALVHPMRRGDPQNIVIHVPTDREDTKHKTDIQRDEYVPVPLSKKFANPDYVPPSRLNRTTSRRDDTLVIETINIHNTTVDKDKDTQFIVTMDGFDPNAFLAKKLKTEGLLDDEEDIAVKPAAKPAKNGKTSETPPKKRLSDTSDDSDTQVIIKPIEKEDSLEKAEKRKSVEESKKAVEESPPVKKRKASPIVDGHVVVTTAAAMQHKYDAVPPLSSAEKKAVWCRSFPLCRYGAACAFQHPRCKAPPLQASAVVVTPNYKSISAILPNVCKYYPGCANPACHFYHPKPCRYGPACANKLQCNFYHNDVPKWRYPL
ncbi:hypothetical protein NE865_04719 [Phthorimaea operculella]|nr:hypothetical protein NE865_04719 [Phthorimaea operculella]